MTVPKDVLSNRTLWKIKAIQVGYDWYPVEIYNVNNMDRAAYTLLLLLLTRTTWYKHFVCKEMNNFKVQCVRQLFVFVSLKCKTDLNHFVKEIKHKYWG